MGHQTPHRATSSAAAGQGSVCWGTWNADCWVTACQEGTSTTSNSSSRRGGYWPLPSILGYLNTLIKDKIFSLKLTEGLNTTTVVGPFWWCRTVTGCFEELPLCRADSKWGCGSCNDGFGFLLSCDRKIVCICKKTRSPQFLVWLCRATQLLNICKAYRKERWEGNVRSDLLRPSWEASPSAEDPQPTIAVPHLFLWLFLFPEP